MSKPDLTKLKKKPDLSAITAKRKTELNPEIEAIIKAGEVAEVELDKVYRDELQPRPREEVLEGIQEFADQLERDKFQLVQLPVYSITDKGFQIVVGERRTEAFKIKGREKITAIIRKFTEEEKEKIILMQYIENDDDLKKPLSPVADAKWWRRFIDAFHGGNISSAATSRGKSITDIHNRLQILEGPEYLVDFAKKSTIRDAATLAAMVRLDKRFGSETVQDVIDDYTAGNIKMSLRSYVEGLSKAAKAGDLKTEKEVISDVKPHSKKIEKNKKSDDKTANKEEPIIQDAHPIEARFIDSNKKLKGISFRVRLADSNNRKDQLLSEVDSLIRELQSAREDLKKMWELGNK